MIASLANVNYHMINLRQVLLIVSFLSFSICSHAQDSLNMRVMANLDGLGADYNDVWGYSWGDKEYAIVGSNTAINIVDVTDCGNPTLVSAWVDGGSKVWRDFKDYKDYVYAVCDNCSEGLQIISKANPVDSTWQYTDNFTRAHNIYIDESSGRLYVAGIIPNNYGLQVYDLDANPTNPPLLATINFRDWDDGAVASGTNWYVHDVYVRNDTAYCSHGNNGHANWDMSDLSDIQLLGDFDNAGYNHSSWTHDELPLEYVAREVPAGMPLEVYDISDMSDISVIRTFSHSIHPPSGDDPISRPHNPYYRHDRLYLSNYHDGLKVYDLSDDPEDPQILAYYDTYDINNGNYNGFEGCWGTYPYLPSGCLLASDISTGLYTMKLLVPPTRDTEVTDVDVILDTPAASLYFASTDSKIWRFRMGGAGTILKSIATSVPSATSEVINSNLRLTTPGAGIYMRNNLGEYYKVSIADGGTISSVLVAEADLPTEHVTFSGQNIYISQYAAGVEFTSPDGTCYRLSINPGGSNSIVSDCD